MSPGWCGKDFESSFGPTVLGCRGNFDFTSFFEQLFLSIVPSVIFLLLLSLRISQLFRSSHKVRPGFLLPAKILIATANVALQLYLLICWTRDTSSLFRINTTIPAAALSLVDGLGIILLSSLEHVRSFRPSTVLQIFLSLTLLFDIAICRTMWLTGIDTTMTQVFTTCVVLKLVLLCLEIVEKRHLLDAQYCHLKSQMTCGVINISVFWWLNSLFITGLHKTLVLADLEDIEEDHCAENLERNLKKNWANASRHTPHALLRTMAWTLRWSLAAGIIPRLCVIGFKFSQPFLINALIKNIQSPIEMTNAGYGLAGAYALVYFGLAVATGLYWYKVYRTITMVRGSLIAIVYSYTLDMALSSPDQSAPSALMSTDVERICTSLRNVHELWANLIEAGIAVYILETQLGIACISPAILALGCGFATLFLSSHIGQRQGVWLKAIQKRLKVTESTLGSVKGIKMMGLTDLLSGVIQGMRVDELNLSLKYRQLLIVSILLSLLMNVIGPQVTFTVFTIISAVKGSGTLLTAEAFTSITVLALIGAPLMTLIQAVPLLMSAVGSFTRVQDFLNQPGREDPRQADSTSTEAKSSKSLTHKESDIHMHIPLEDLKRGQIQSWNDHYHNLVTISNCNIGWAKTQEPILHDINLTIDEGSFTVVVGPVGCGKSTLLKAILGEAKDCDGIIDVHCQEIAFCDQTPWLSYDSIRENIIGMASFPFDEDWYRLIIWACALEEDFKQLINGDQTMVGSKGIALSGGQRQRVSIARALYSRKKFAMFDDVLSGLDMKTEEQLFIRVFGPDGLLRQHNITTVLVTHRVRRLLYASKIVAINNLGNIAQQGTFASLNSVDGYIKSLVIEEVTESAESNERIEEPRNSTLRSPTKAADDKVAELSRQTGDLSLYKYYLGFAGFGTVAVTWSMMIIHSFCLVFPTVWLSWWSNANEKNSGHDLGMYLGVYILLGVVAVITLAIFCWQLILIIAPRVGSKLHSIVLQHAFLAPLSFLTQTDTGTILNRFSQDMQLIDFQLTFAGLNTAEAFTTTIVRLIVVCVTAKYVASAMPFGIVVIYVIQKGYLRTSRQLRHLDLEAKAPIYSLFVETLNGLATVRAFGWQEKLRRRNHGLVDSSQKPFYLLYCIQRWLQFVLDILIAVLAILVVVFAIRFQKQTSGGSTGVALVNVLTCNQALVAFVQNWTLLETSIGAVSRVRAFSIHTPMEVRSKPAEAPPKWPIRGQIEIDNISASYETGSPVLRNVTMSIAAGTKLGVCGRTGSGKSSFILCILQILDVSSGSIHIDGVDLSEYSREVARSVITTVPQDAVIFEGSVRFNIDPYASSNDLDIENALRKVNLWDIIKQGDGLDAAIGSLHLSHGQLQLFSLARAMLSKAKILILDEATSSVDGETNHLMQSLIRSEFTDSVVICVEHQLESLLDYDQVAVFEGGKLAEFGDPRELMQKDSMFRQMVEA